MTLPGGRFTITFNGEITNYVEIKTELVALGETFASGTDTEVLLKAWARWGKDTLERLEGMYAFAILDTQERTVTLVRDPFGIKPLFYTHSADRLSFCSELSGLLEIDPGLRRLDWQTAVDYLQWGTYDRSERTFLEGVRQLKPGHYLVVDADSGRASEPTAFWHPNVREAFTGTYEEASEIVRGLFVDSVKRNLRSDVALGIALSGGIDSSAIVGAVRHLEPDLPITTFSFVAPGFARSEHEWVKLVADHAKAISHSVVAEPGDLSRDLDELIISQGEPFASTSIYAQFRVFKLARDHDVRVTLDGQGGDEVFAGYSGFPAQRMHSLIERGRLRQASTFARNWASWPDRDMTPMLMETAAQFLPRRARGRVLRSGSSPLLDTSRLKERGVRLYPEVVQTGALRGRRVVSQLRSALTSQGLPALLRHADRNSMHFSIESRVPFLDRALAEFTLALPEDWLVGNDGSSKRILRDAMRGMVPDQVLQRRDKVGFETPEREWEERLANEDVDRDHPIGFLKPGRENTVTGGYTESELNWAGRSHWRLINLRRWVALMGVDAR